MQFLIQIKFNFVFQLWKFVLYCEFWRHVIHWTKTMQRGEQFVGFSSMGLTVCVPSSVCKKNFLKTLKTYKNLSKNQPRLNLQWCYVWPPVFRLIFCIYTQHSSHLPRHFFLHFSHSHLIHSTPSFRLSQVARTFPNPAGGFAVSGGLIIIIIAYRDGNEQK